MLCQLAVNFIVNYDKIATTLNSNNSKTIFDNDALSLGNLIVCLCSIAITGLFYYLHGQKGEFLVLRTEHCGKLTNLSVSGVLVRTGLRKENIISVFTHNALDLKCLGNPCEIAC